VPLLAVAGIFLLAAVGPARAATTWHVRTNGSGNFTTIQACVNAMAPGDTCLVGAGSYSERVTFPSSKSGHAGALTVIQAETNLTATNWGFDTTGASYIRIQGFYVALTSSLTGWNNGVGILVNGNNIQVVSNYVFNTHYPGVLGTGLNALIASNHMYMCGIGIWINGGGWLVEGNEVERPQYFSEIGDADFMRFFGTNQEIRGNYSHGCIESEIGPAHVDGFQTYDDNGDLCQHIRIEGNRVEGYFRQGVIMEATNYSNAFDIVICNNIFSGSNSSWALFESAGLRQVDFYNNDVVNMDCGVYMDPSVPCDIRNNIFYGTDCFSLGSQATGGSNLLYMAGTSVSALFPGDLVNVDPQFVNATNFDYHLHTNSPAINLGATLATVTNDLDGVPRPQGAAYDIGAYEYTTNVSAAVPAISVRGQGATLSITLNGQPGRSYFLRSTTDFKTWSVVTNVSLGTPSMVISQPTPGNRLYYRALLAQ
jgi:hypothetical protein